MSGLHTSERFAVLDTNGGMRVDTYSSLDELLRAVYYRTVVGLTMEKAAQTRTEAEYCDALLAYADKVHAELRESVIKDYDPARLRMPEVWPFCMASNGALLAADKFYGFADDGGMYGDKAGYATEEDCVAAVALEIGELHPGEKYFSREQKDLGGVMCCVLTGRAYVDRLYYLAGGHDYEDIKNYGNWSAALEESMLPANKTKREYPPSHDVFVVAVPRRTPEASHLGAHPKEGEVRAALQSACSEFTGTAKHPQRASVLYLLNRATVL